jgi:alpha-N-arabinofuranosidase
MATMVRSEKKAALVRGVVSAVAMAGVLACSTTVALAQHGSAPAELTIDPGTIVSPVSPTLYGMMTEEINHAFDGGLYAEMVQNRTMRASWIGVDHWAVVEQGNAHATMTLDKKDGPSKALPTSLQLTVATAAAGEAAGVSNTGYWGMALKPMTEYHGSFYAQTDDLAGAPLTARLINNQSGAVEASATVTLHDGAWSQYTFTLKTAAIPASGNNHLELTVAKPGTLHLQLVSLMPPTYHNRVNGNRPDLMEKMAGLHPHFLRLPGGNYLEGDHLRDWYNWHETIGPLVDRPGHQAPWSYWSTDGLGLLEFLEWCEDLKIEPVLAVYAGYSLQHEHIKPGKDLEPYVQSAIDEVQYVTGDTSTKWGAERAKDGHPAPFPLHYIEIGNEDEFDNSGSYPERFAQFADALHKAYPQYKLIATTPVKETEPLAQPDVIDDHYYKPLDAMLAFTKHYDDAPRTGPKIFIGEWATMSGTPTPDFAAALGDAAWMTSMERNSDLIVMSSYAPLLVNINPGGLQWTPDLIGYDSARSYVSPSYWAQSLFGGHIGDGTPRSSISGASDRFYYSATVSSANHVLHLKFVNATTKAQPLQVRLDGVAGARTAKMYSLHAATLEATNSIDHPNEIHPVESTVPVKDGAWSHTVPALTIEVIDVPLR